MARWLSACLAVAALAGCAALPRPLGTEAVTPAYAAGGGHYDDGASIIILARVFDEAGVWPSAGSDGAFDDPAHAVPERDSRQGGGNRGRGRPIASGLRALPEAPFRPEMTGAIARCMVTDRPWRPEYAVAVPRIRIPRLEFPDEDGSGFGFGWGSSVVFRGGSVHRPLP